MVNTFLPYPDYAKTAASLDNKRLGKQRVEALQILRVNLGYTKGWRNHPAAVMWRGHEGSLCVYTLAMCIEWVNRGYKDSVANQVAELMKEIPPDISRPWWMGNQEFHESHQSNLKRKNPLHYTFAVPDDLPYKWPKEDGTLRVTVYKTRQNTKGAKRASKSAVSSNARKKPGKGRSVVSTRKGSGRSR